jgi:hypothetical protein
MRSVLSVLVLLTLVWAACDKTREAVCGSLPLCGETPSRDPCPDPRCCEKSSSGEWQVNQWWVDCEEDALSDQGLDAANYPDELSPE